MLRGEEAPGGVEGEAFAIAQPGGVALRRGEMLILFVGVVEPDAGASLELGAGLMAGELGMRFWSWQELVAEPRSTNKWPSSSMAKGCIG